MLLSKNICVMRNSQPASTFSLRCWMSFIFPPASGVLGIAGAADAEVALHLDIAHQLGGVFVVLAGRPLQRDVAAQGQYVLHAVGLQLCQYPRDLLPRGETQVRCARDSTPKRREMSEASSTV